MFGATKLVAPLVVAALAGMMSTASAGPAGRSVQILAEYPLPAERSHYVDVRWSGAGSVYVTRLMEGVFEVELGNPVKTLRQLVPAPEVLKLGQLNAFAHLAATPQHLLVASGHTSFAWRPLGVRRGDEITFQGEGFATIEDIDLAGDRLLILGLRDEIPKNHDGGIVWLGSLAEGSKSWRSLLADENRQLDSETWLSARCAALVLGGARFLEDGSFLVVPGFQPGAYLFNPQGQMVQSWSSQEIGLTTDCRRVPSGALMRPGILLRWLARHRALEEILPLPEGPGLLVRSLDGDGKVHWDLTVLGARGIVTYPLPLVGTQPTDRILGGDVQDGRIVLLMATGELWPAPSASYAGRLIVAELPK